MKSLQTDTDTMNDYFPGAPWSTSHCSFQLVGEGNRRSKMPEQFRPRTWCFDGKAIAYLPAKPARYVGYDANWENDWTLRGCNGRRAQFLLHRGDEARADESNDGDRFDIASRWRHSNMFRGHVDAYLQKIAQHLNGYFFSPFPTSGASCFSENG